MRTGQRIQRTFSAVRPCLAAAVMLSSILLMDFALTLLAAGRGDIPSSPSPAPESFRTAAERAGNLAAMHEGAGTGVHVLMRGGRSSPTFARRLQPETAHLDPGRTPESVPNSPERVRSPEQTFLFQLFPRCFLPVRAGPLSGTDPRRVGNALFPREGGAAS